jgi:hypothetical protein
MSEPVGNVAAPEQSAETGEVKPDEIKIKLVSCHKNQNILSSQKKNLLAKT